ncbi:MAG: AAA family ATPase [Firmicutes bacterium]|nr:AAA family ATPase [Bacillota bacterium]
MILQSIKMKNFRQYYGDQDIEFAQGNKNITIIFGTNGQGKTGIFRALMFALYGSTHIQQDNIDETVHLVNLRKLEENEGNLVIGFVRVKFSHKNKQYEIARQLKAVKNNSRIQERFDKVELYITDENGNYSPIPINDPQEVKRIMSSILNEDIKDFFLFDAEKIDTLAKTDSQVKKEVKSAILRLLQIDNVDKAQEILKRLYTKENNNIVSNSKNIDISSKNNEIYEENFKRERNIELKSQIEENLRECKSQIEKYNLQLSQNAEIKLIQDKLHEQEKQFNMIDERIDDKKKEVYRILLQKSPFLLLKNTFVNVSNYLDQVLSKQENIVPIEVIDKSLNTGVCACCNNDLNQHLENLNYVESLKHNYKRSLMGSFTSSIKNMIIDQTNSFDENDKLISSLLKEIRELNKTRELILTQIEQTNIEIGNKAKSQLDMSKVESMIQQSKHDSDQMHIQIAKLKVEIEASEENVVTLEKSLEKMMTENEHLKHAAKVLEILGSLKDDIKGISEVFSTEMRESLKESTTEIFKTLIDVKDRNLVKNIEINKKFEIEIIGWDNTEITQDISQGQRQIVALSFITALAKVAAGGSDKISFPLFMDTPFGRISGTNRDHLIENIPGLTSQWILLLTDTELTTNEERSFKATNRLGKWYRLNQKELYHTEIEPVSLSDTIATRGI